MKKQEIANRLHSLVVSEWNAIKGGGIIKGSAEGCGVLFIDGFAYATNGHYAVRISSPSNPAGGRAFWLDIDKYFSEKDSDRDFCWGECDENSSPIVTGLVSAGGSDLIQCDTQDNPLTDYGVPMSALKRIFSLWQANIVRVSVNDLTQSIKSAGREIKERRKTHMICHIRGVDLEIAYMKDGGVFFRDLIPLLVKPGERIESTPASYFMVNSSYMYKILDIFENVYNVVSFSFNDVQEDTIAYGDQGGKSNGSRVLMIKGHSRNKPDIRVAIAQAKPNPGSR